MDVSIIIVSWNTRDLLRRCLHDALAASAGLAVEILVVDNGSTDGSQDMVRDQFPLVQLITNEANIGFVRANNQAIEQARGEYVLLLNSDAFLAPDALHHLHAFMHQHPQAGAVGPRLSYADGSLQRSCTAFPTLFTELCLMLQLDRLFPRSKLFAHFWLSGWDYSTVREVDVIMGACLLVRRAAIERVGLLDERFFMYSEEVDWCYRLRQAGWQLYVVPQAQAVHIWGGSTGTARVELFVQLFRSRVLFFSKHRSHLATAALKMVFGIGSVLRLAVSVPLLLWSWLRHQPPHPKVACYWQLLQALPHL